MQQSGPVWPLNVSPGHTETHQGKQASYCIVGKRKYHIQLYIGEGRSADIGTYIRAIFSFTHNALQLAVLSHY